MCFHSFSERVGGDEAGFPAMVTNGTAALFKASCQMTRGISPVARPSKTEVMRLKKSAYGHCGTRRREATLTCLGFPLYGDRDGFTLSCCGAKQKSQGDKTAHTGMLFSGTVVGLAAGI